MLLLFGKLPLDSSCFLAVFVARMLNFQANYSAWHSFRVPLFIYLSNY